MTSYNIELGQKIKEARKKRKMTQAQLAEKLSITPQYLGNIENSRANPGVNVLICLANELGMTLDFMLMDQVEDKKSAYEEDLDAIRLMMGNKRRMVLEQSMYYANVGVHGREALNKMEARNQSILN